MIHQMELLNKIREILLKRIYPFPSGCRYCSWFMLIVWCSAMMIVSILYGLQFDLLYDVESPHGQQLEDDCSLTLNLKSRLNLNATTEFVETQQASLSSDYSDDYSKYLGEGVFSATESKRWLLSVVQSLLLSIFWWQPITIYVLTWIKLWAFTHHLELSDGIGNLCKLMMKVCCRRTDEHLFAEIDDRRESVVRNKRRPLDVMGFYGNKDIFLTVDHIADEEWDCMASSDESEEIELVVSTTSGDIDDYILDESIKERKVEEAVYSQVLMPPIDDKEIQEEEEQDEQEEDKLADMTCI